MMKPLLTVVPMTALAIAGVALPVRAQDIDEMVKWTSAQAIHYDVVAEYAGATAILVPPESGSSPRTAYQAEASDRYEVGFDWNPGEMAMVGEPVIRNFPSTLPKGTPGYSMFGQPCPPPKIDGSYDHVEVVGAKTGPLGSNTLELALKRSYPAAQVAYAGEGPCNNWLDWPAKTENLMGGINVPLGILFAMPEAAGSNLTVGRDGKTITLVDEPNGWKYTYTLQIVN